MAPKGEVLIEMRRIGAYVKVTAFDPVSLVEVSIVGAARAPETQLRAAAIKRLEYVLAKGRQG